MIFLNRFTRGDLALSRVEAFSDGVFAIIVTLLVLDFKVPELQSPNDASQLLHYLISLLPSLFSWTISFVIVCKFWLNHHHLLSQARRADYAMIWLNCIFLMFQSFVPFPTALMGKFYTNPLALTLFGTVMALNTLLFLAVRAYIILKLLKPEFKKYYRAPITPIGFISPFLYMCGAAAGWFSPLLAFAFYTVTPLIFIVPPQEKVQASG